MGGISAGVLQVTLLGCVVTEVCEAIGCVNPTIIGQDRWPGAKSGYLTDKMERPK